MLDSAVVLEFNRARDAEEMALLVDDAGGGDVTLIGVSECDRETLTDFAVGGGGGSAVDVADASRC